MSPAPAERATTSLTAAPARTGCKRRMGEDHIDGGSGKTTISGDEGDDVLRGGKGGDTSVGGDPATTRRSAVRATTIGGAARTHLEMSITSTGDGNDYGRGGRVSAARSCAARPAMITSGAGTATT